MVVSASPVRPRFQVRLPCDPDQVMERLRQRLPECPRCTAISVGRHAELDVPAAQRRIWSPHLSVTAEHDPPSGSLVRGRFGPHPHLWTLYMFLAFGLGFALLVGLSWGYAQWAMEETPWALVSVPVASVLGAGLYLVSLVGQRLGAEQMLDLRDALEVLVAPETS
jgi:hypothetical protein